MASPAPRLAAPGKTSSLDSSTQYPRPEPFAGVPQAVDAGAPPVLPAVPDEGEGDAEVHEPTAAPAVRRKSRLRPITACTCLSRRRT
jgi:hypothetical protein